MTLAIGSSTVVLICMVVAAIASRHRHRQRGEERPRTTNDHAYWFPAKRIGWGWGLPRRWQGWVVIAAYLAVVLVLVQFFPPEREPMWFGSGVAFATAVLVLVCWLKGEPPQWRGPLL